MEELFKIAGEVQRPGRWLVDDIPWLRFVPAWFPGAGFQQTAAYAKKHSNRIESIPFNWAKEQIGSFTICSRVFLCSAYLFVARNLEITSSRSHQKGFIRRVAIRLAQKRKMFLTGVVKLYMLAELILLAPYFSEFLVIETL